MPSSNEKLSPEILGVKTLAPTDLIPNPHNPRLLFDREPLQVLEDSIRKVGILVPLTVYQSKKTGQYIILDGQRRWTCASKIPLPEVPVNVVAEPTLVQNIVTMFQIHKLREDWELMPTALKLELLMNELQEKGEKKLSELTGLDRAVVTRCKKLLSYPPKYQDLMLFPDPNLRIKADFFIELYAVRNDRFINGLDWFSKNTFTQRMLEKYLGGHGIKAVTDFRTIKQLINNARKANKEKKIGELLQEFTFNDKLTIEHLAIKSADVSADARKLLSHAAKLHTEIEDLDVQTFYGETKLWDELEKLATTIRKKLISAGRRVK